MKNNCIKLPKEILSLCDSDNVDSLNNYYKNNSNLIPKGGAIYCFWWIGKKNGLLRSANRKLIVNGPGGQLIELKYNNWFPDGLKYYPLYVGKTTTLRARIRQHMRPGTPGRMHPRFNNAWIQPITTTCQLRYGIEHIFPQNNSPLDIIYQNVGISIFQLEGPDNVAKRFYLEDFAIGYLKPWFNLDSER